MTGMDIPEVIESGLVITIRKRGTSIHEVEIVYAGLPIKRYIFASILAEFFGRFFMNIPVFGLWLFMPSKRRYAYEHAYKKTLDQFLKQLREDVGKVVLEGE